MNTQKQARHHFTRQFKRKALLEYAKGKNPSDILKDFNISLTTDKKYALKLFHKWKRELYKNINLLSLNYINIDKNYADKEINSIGKDDEIDDILDELLTKNNKK